MGVVCLVDVVVLAAVEDVSFIVKEKKRKREKMEIKKYKTIIFDDLAHVFSKHLNV